MNSALTPGKRGFGVNQKEITQSKFWFLLCLNSSLRFLWRAKRGTFYGPSVLRPFGFTFVIIWCFEGATKTRVRFGKVARLHKLNWTVKRQTEVKPEFSNEMWNQDSGNRIATYLRRRNGVALLYLVPSNVRKMSWRWKFIGYFVTMLPDEALSPTAFGKYANPRCSMGSDGKCLPWKS